MFGFSVLVWCYCCFSLVLFGFEFGFSLVWAFCQFCYSAVLVWFEFGFRLLPLCFGLVSVLLHLCVSLVLLCF